MQMLSIMEVAPVAEGVGHAKVARVEVGSDGGQTLKK